MRVLEFVNMLAHVMNNPPIGELSRGAAWRRKLKTHRRKPRKWNHLFGWEPLSPSSPIPRRRVVGQTLIICLISSGPGTGGAKYIIERRIISVIICDFPWRSLKLPSLCGPLQLVRREFSSLPSPLTNQHRALSPHFRCRCRGPRRRGGSLFINSFCLFFNRVERKGRGVVAGNSRSLPANRRQISMVLCPPRPFFRTPPLAAFSWLFCRRI